jgi:alkylhydroperoxidase family enzyme
MTPMTDPHAEHMQRVAEAILRTPGELDVGIRTAIEARAAELGGRTEHAEPDVPEDLRAYVEKVARHAYKVVDGDLEQLKAAGYSEDAIFEATLASALGAARSRLARGLDAVEGLD